MKVERAIEKVGGEVMFKLPKTKRGLRAIAIDDSLLELLVAERESISAPHRRRGGRHGGRSHAGQVAGRCVDVPLAGRDLRDHVTTMRSRPYLNGARQGLALGGYAFTTFAAAMASASSVKVCRSHYCWPFGT